MKLNKALEGLDGCVSIRDDIIVYGKNQQEHDRNLHTVFESLKGKNLTLNRQKYLFSNKQVKFF